MSGAIIPLFLPTHLTMKRHFLAFLLVFVLAAPAVAQNRVALMTDIKGTVEIARSGSADFRSADWGTQLFEGDRIRTGAASATSLLFSNGNMLSLEDNSAMTVTNSSNETTSLSGSMREVGGELLAAASDLSLHRAGEGEIAVLGGLRSGGSASALTAAYPVNTRIAATNPTFNWQAVDSFDEYNVIVRTTDGQVWSGTTDGTSIAYPADAPALVPGTTYFWHVEAEDMLDVISSEITSFEVLTAEERKQVEAGMSEIEGMFGADNRSGEFHYLTGSLMVRHGMLGDAINAFRWIADQHPESASAHRILGGLYSEIGQKDQAIRALQKAVALTDSN